MNELDNEAITEEEVEREWGQGIFRDTPYYLTYLV